MTLSCSASVVHPPSSSTNGTCCFTIACFRQNHFSTPGPLSDSACREDPEELSEQSVIGGYSAVVLTCI